MGSGKFANSKYPVVSQGGEGGGGCRGLGTVGIDRCIMHNHCGDNMLLTKEAVHSTMLSFTASLLFGHTTAQFSSRRGLLLGYFVPLDLHCMCVMTVNRERIKTIVYLIQ